jgi:hypothetical protein
MWLSEVLYFFLKSLLPLIQRLLSGRIVRFSLIARVFLRALGNSILNRPQWLIGLVVLYNSIPLLYKKRLYL